MWNISASILVVYLGFYLFVVFLSLSIACGLYYIAELIEEYPKTTQRLLSYTIKAELILHLILLIDRLPVLNLLLGVASHISYFRLLKRFPYISVTSADGLISTGFFLANVGLWCRYYYRSFYTIEYIGAFVLVTTVLVPFVLFLSMAGEQAVLPGAGGYPYSAGSSGNLNRTISGSLLGGGGTAGQGAAGAAAGAGQKRRSLALKLFDLLKRKRQQVLPATHTFLKEKV